MPLTPARQAGVGVLRVVALEAHRAGASRGQIMGLILRLKKPPNPLLELLVRPEAVKECRIYGSNSPLDQVPLVESDLLGDLVEVGWDATTDLDKGNVPVIPESLGSTLGSLAAGRPPTMCHNVTRSPGHNLLWLFHHNLLRLWAHRSGFDNFLLALVSEGAENRDRFLPLVVHPDLGDDWPALE